MLVSRAAVPVCAPCLVGPTSSSSTSLLSLNGGMRVGRPAGDARVSTHAARGAVRCPGALPITAVQHGQVRQARKQLGRKVGLARHLALQQVEPPQVRQRGLRAPAIPNDHCLATDRCLATGRGPGPSALGIAPVAPASRCCLSGCCSGPALSARPGALCSGPPGRPRSCCPPESTA